MLRKDAFKQIVEVGKRLYSKGMVAANDGNLSVRLNDNEIVITPTGICKGCMTMQDMVVANWRSGKTLYGKKKITSEAPMHFAAYATRSDIGAIVHAHPIVSTALAVAGLPLDQCILPEIILTIGIVPLAEYATPSTIEVPESIKQLLPKHDAILLANHGAITLGKDLWEAFYKMERLEHFAQIYLVSRLLGNQRILTTEEVSRLQQLTPNSPIVCETCNVKIDNTGPEIENKPDIILDAFRRLVSENKVD